MPAMIFGVDPGPTRSGWALLAGATVADSGVADNADLLRWVGHGNDCSHLAIEMVEGMGMPVGAETFATVRWIGRFQQAWRDPEAVILVYRRQVKLAMCGSSKAKDGNIRLAVIDRLGPPGKKACPGPTYGVSSHAWQALAVAIVAADRINSQLDKEGRSCQTVDTTIPSTTPG